MAKNKQRFVRLGFGVVEPGILNTATGQTDHGRWLSQYSVCWSVLSIVRERYDQVLHDLVRLLDDFPSAPRDAVTQDAQVQWLRDWCHRHRLVADLVLRVGWTTVQAWRTDHEALRERRWVFPDVVYPLPEVSMSIPVNDLKSEAALRDYLYTEALRQLATKGWTLTPRREPDHRGWLVDHVVGGKSYSKIAREVGRGSASTVSDAVRPLAKFIGLTLPPTDPGGRPRTSRRSRQ